MVDFEKNVESGPPMSNKKDSKKDNKKDKNSKEYHYMPETFDRCKDRFGIIFYDNLDVSICIQELENLKYILLRL